MDDIPPIIGGEESARPKKVARWRWWLHLVVLGSFPLIYGGAGYLKRHDTKSILPETLPGLVQVSFIELAFFAVIFGIAWLGSRVTREQLLLKWRRGIFPALFGFGYSILLRVLIMAVMFAMIAVWLILSHGDTKNLQGLLPTTERIVNPAALTQNPLYLAWCLTFVSFVVAALREELWRAGMLAGIKELFPESYADWPGRITAVAIVAVLFGLGHTPQGIAGVGITTVLGLGLGAIMVWHRSIWEAVIAHGFFDAATFLALYVVLKYFPGAIPGM